MFGLPFILWVEQTTRYDRMSFSNPAVRQSTDQLLIGFSCGCYVTTYTSGSSLPVMCRKHRASGRYT